MLNIFKKIFFLSLLLFIFILPFVIQAQIPFQQGVFLPGFNETQIQGDSIAKYINAFYKWSVIAIAIFAVLMIINAGFGMVLNSGNAAKVTEKRDDIFRSIIGLLLALVAIPMLNMINPALVRLSGLTLVGISRVSDELPPVSDPSLVCSDKAEHDCGETYRQVVEGREIFCCGIRCSQGYGCAIITGGDLGIICPAGTFLFNICQKTDNPQGEGGKCPLDRICDQNCCGRTKKVPCCCPEGTTCPCEKCGPIQACVGVMCE